MQDLHSQRSSGLLFHNSQHYSLRSNDVLIQAVNLEENSS
jgi:hypothetical protein